MPARPNHAGPPSRVLGPGRDCLPRTGIAVPSGNVEGGPWPDTAYIRYMDHPQFFRLYGAGKDIRRERKSRKDHGQQSLEQVRDLREQAARSAAVCADCFQPIAPGASVTMVIRRVHIPAQQLFARRDPAYDRKLTVPICLTCWLIDIARHAEAFSDQHEGQLHCLRGLMRFRCDGCGRPIRRYRDRAYHGYQTERVCCTDCHRSVINARARDHRRVHHDKIKCKVCRKPFMPTRSDAKFCGNTCRQKAFRRQKPMRTFAQIIAGLPAKRRAKIDARSNELAEEMALHVSDDPQFTEADHSGKAFVIVGAKPSKSQS